MLTEGLGEAQTAFDLAIDYRPLPDDPAEILGVIEAAHGPVE